METFGRDRSDLLTLTLFLKKWIKWNVFSSFMNESSKSCSMCISVLIDANLKNYVDPGVQLRPMIQTFAVRYKKLMEDRLDTATRLNTQTHISPQEFSEVVDSVLAIWNDVAIREAYDRRRFILNFISFHFFTTRLVL